MILDKYVKVSSLEFHAKVAPLVYGVNGKYINNVLLVDYMNQVDDVLGYQVGEEYYALMSLAYER